MPRENHCELREAALVAFNPETARMLMHYRVVAQRKAKSASLARGLGGEEGIEDLVDDVRRNSGAVVAHTDLYPVTVIPRAYPEDRRVIGRGPQVVSLEGGMKAVVEQVQQGPADILGGNVDQAGIGVVVSIDGAIGAHDWICLLLQECLCRCRVIMVAWIQLHGSWAVYIRCP